MNKLQQLLDERWPVGSDKTIGGRLMNEHNRKVFSDGYNARIAEEKVEHSLNEIEDYAIRFANTQDSAHWNASKSGYMAGAQDWYTSIDHNSKR